MGVCCIDPVGRLPAVVVVHVPSVAVGHFELNAGQGLLRNAVQLPNSEGTLTLVPEGELMDGGFLNLDFLRRSIQQIAFHGLCLLDLQPLAGFQFIDGDQAVPVCDVNAIVFADERAVAVCDQEGHAS